MSEMLVVPSFGESITEVLVERWLVDEGQPVKVDDPVVSLESDKATLEVPSPASGVLKKILKKAGETAQVGEAIGEIDAADGKPAAAKTEEKPKAEATADEGGDGQPAETAAKPKAEAAKPKAEAPSGPAARRVMAEAGLDAGAIEGSGPGGRILKEDAQRAAQAPTEKPAASAKDQPAAKDAPAAERQAPKKEAAAETPAPPSPAPRRPAGVREEQVVPMSPIRKVIAQRLLQATQNTAMLTTFNEVDMSRVLALRQSHQDAFKARWGTKLGFMSFFIKASIEALKAFPALNAEIRGETIVYKHYFDIGVAVSSEKGLTVPVIRDADGLSFGELEQIIADFGARAQKSKLKLEELQGGTFTISNGGVFGSMLSTPILNPPQSGVLGMHNIVKRPVVVDDQIVVRPIMMVALTYDHRIVDGREAVSFLVRVKECVEGPERILLEV